MRYRRSVCTAPLSSVALLAALWGVASARHVRWITKRTPGITLNPVGGEAQLAGVEVQSAGAAAGFPFIVPAIASLDRLDLDAPVTILVGENGTGKSTFIESLAIATQLPAVGSARPSADPTLGPQRRLAKRFRLTWRGRTHRGFFLRAEDFLAFKSNLVLRGRSTRLSWPASMSIWPSRPSMQGASRKGLTMRRSARWRAATEPIPTLAPMERRF